MIFPAMISPDTFFVCLFTHCGLWCCRRHDSSSAMTELLALLNIFTETMMTSSNGNIFRATGPLCGEFTGPGEFPAQRPVTRSFDVSFDLRPNKRLSKQSWGWRLETASWSLWRQYNAKRPPSCWRHFQIYIFVILMHIWRIFVADDTINNKAALVQIPIRRKAIIWANRGPILSTHSTTMI